MDIKQLIKDYINIDDSITEANKGVKDLRKKRTDLEGDIKQYMIDNNISKVDIGNGSLRISKSKTKKKIDKKSILSILIDSLDHDKATEIIDELFDDSNCDEVTKLERSKK